MPRVPAIAVSDASNLNFSFRLSIKFYRLSSSSVGRRDEPSDQRQRSSARTFTASPKFGNGTGPEPAVAERAAPVIARAALSIRELVMSSLK
jgi:hypothetical protein